MLSNGLCTRHPPLLEKWANRRANSPQNSSLTFRSTPTVSYSDGHSLSASISSLPLQLINASFSNGKPILRDLPSPSHIRCAAGTRASSRTVHPASLTRPSSAGYTNNSSHSATRANLPTTYSTSSTRTRTAQSTSRSLFVLLVSLPVVGWTRNSSVRHDQPYGARLFDHFYFQGHSSCTILTETVPSHTMRCFKSSSRSIG